AHRDAGGHDDLRAAPFALAEYVRDRVAAGWLSDHEARGAQGAVGEELALRGAVRELNALAVAEQEHRVITDHVAAAQPEHAELLAAALPDVAHPTVHLLELGADALRGFGQALGRAARRVDLLSVMDFGDLHVEIRTEPAHRVLHELGQHLHAQAHV